MALSSPKKRRNEQSVDRHQSNSDSKITCCWVLAIAPEAPEATGKQLENEPRSSLRSQATQLTSRGRKEDSEGDASFWMDLTHASPRKLIDVLSHRTTINPWLCQCMRVVSTSADNTQIHTNDVVVAGLGNSQPMRICEPVCSPRVAFLKCWGPAALH